MTDKNNTTAADASTEALLEGPIGQAFDVVKTPVMAYVGMGDLAVEAINGIITDWRTTTEARITDAQERVIEARNDAQRQVIEGAERVQALPSDVSELMKKFQPEELRKVAEAYVQVAAGIYSGLAERGEGVVGRMREEAPQFDAGIRKVADVVSSSVDLSEEALGKVAKTTRNLGDSAAEAVSGAAAGATEAVEKATESISDDLDEAAAAVGSLNEPAAKKAPVKKAAATKPAAKKAPAKKSAAKKAPAKKTES